MTKANTIIAPSFDTYAKSVIKAKETAHKAMTKADAAIDATMQKFVDAWALAGFTNSRADVDKLGKAIRESETVKNIIDTEWLKRKTFTEYAQSAMRAFYHGVPFEASLKNNPDMVLPWGKSKESSGAKSGKVESTSRAELDKTLSKALKQARLLGLTEFAANILDLCLESLDDFSEVAE